ncbi:MAG: rhamnan synthesis F family protein [Dinoroseobacter sp.]|nr:rhamnan synthesis F family protein [Dinoroseobacter sp.]
MPPFWKVKREIRRVGRQATGIMIANTGKLRRLKYDHSERDRIQKTPGKIPMQDDVAVLLIYQPEEIPASVICCLEHLRDKEIATVLVSNAPLDAQSRNQLKELCYLVIERPNVGYDFGGYRDAILELFARGISPNNLFVLNDSIWFPIREGCDLIDRARSDSSDLYGIFYDDKSKQVSKYFLHSYFYRFNKRIFESPIFHRYWTRAPMFDRKDIVIERFERRLTAYFKKMGFTIGARYSPEDLVSAARSLSEEELRVVVEQLSKRRIESRPIFKPAYDLAKQNGDWQTAARDIIESSRFRFYFLDTAPIILINRLRTPILKKHTAENFQEQRDHIFEMGYDKDLLPAVREELRGWNDLIRANKKKTL